jgi:hypothetical protein
MRRKLLLLAFIVAATVVNSFTAPRLAEAACNRTCCNVNDCSCCHLPCQCPMPGHHA